LKAFYFSFISIVRTVLDRLLIAHIGAPISKHALTWDHGRLIRPGAPGYTVQSICIAGLQTPCAASEAQDRKIEFAEYRLSVRNTPNESKHSLIEYFSYMLTKKLHKSLQ